MAENVIPFPVRDSKHQENIQHLRDWRDHIFNNYPDMNDLGKTLADFLLDKISHDLAGYGVFVGGRAA